MTRITRGNVAKKSRKKYLKLAKGFRGLNSRLSTFAAEQIVQSLNDSYKGKKLKKRNFRRFCINQLNLQLKKIQTKYSIFLGELRKSNIFLNTKILGIISNNTCKMIANIA